jgi:hypothetical protein
MAPRKPKIWTENIIKPELLEQVKTIFNRLLQLKFDPHGDENVPIDLPLSLKTKGVWIDFYNKHAKAQSFAEGSMAAALSKLEEYAARFALIFALVRLAAKRPIPLEKVFIDEKSMASGIALAQWFAQETERIYATFSESEEERKQRQLIEYIQGRGGSIRVRDLAHGPQHYRGEGGADKAKRDLQKLV